MTWAAISPAVLDLPGFVIFAVSVHASGFVRPSERARLPWPACFTASIHRKPDYHISALKLSTVNNRVSWDSKTMLSPCFSPSPCLYLSPSPLPCISGCPNPFQFLPQSLFQSQSQSQSQLQSQSQPLFQSPSQLQPLHLFFMPGPMSMLVSFMD